MYKDNVYLLHVLRLGIASTSKIRYSITCIKISYSFSQALKLVLDAHMY